MVPFDARPLGSIPGDAVRLGWTHLEAHSLRGRQLRGRPKRRRGGVALGRSVSASNRVLAASGPDVQRGTDRPRASSAGSPSPADLTPLVSRQPVSSRLN